ncbi:MAG TPA: LysR family transcriptional regulator [Acetobacteraceae bacterium]|nr:LysR family transcriptional regulator [Acetobacteraceae bacterium]
MDLRQLEHFVTVAAEQSFTRAARRLNIVQSGLSASIRTLEDELGAPLLLRTTRRVDLTATGRAFLAEARRVLSAADEARQVVAQMTGLQRGTLSIGIIPGLAPLIDIPELLGRFRDAHSCVEIRLISGGSLLLIDGVCTGELDLAFTQFVGRTPPGTKAWMLACEPLVAVCAPGHALAGRHDVTLGDLVAETFVELRRDWGTRQLIDQVFSESRLNRRIGFEVNDPTMQLDLVAHGLGVALVPKAVICGHSMTQAGKQLGVAELAGPEICWELAAVFAQDEAQQPVGAVTRTFLEFLRATVTLLDESEVGDSDMAMAG